MKSFELNFFQRLKLIQLLSAQDGPLGKTAPYMRTLEEVRFSDDEDSQIVKTPVKDGIVNFSAPNSEFGKKTVDLENADADALSKLLEDWPHFTTLDHQWAQPLLKALKQ